MHSTMGSTGSSSCIARSMRSRMACPALPGRVDPRWRQPTVYRCRMAAAAESQQAATSVPAPKERQRGHQAPASAAPVDPAIQALRTHQSAAARQTFADECRTLVALSRYGVLSSLSSAPETLGFPLGSIVGYADDEQGAPIFSFSTMSPHTRDVMQDGRATLTVTAPGFQGAADARVAVTGRLVRVPDGAAKEAATSQYLAKHPDAFWVSYGDFSWWKMEEVVAVRLVGGFGRAGSIPPKLYAAARPDPVAGLKDLVDAANAYSPEQWAHAVRAAVGADAGIEEARVVSLDRLGLNLSARRGQDATKLRLPFAAAADTAEEVQAQVQALQAAAI